MRNSYACIINLEGPLLPVLHYITFGMASFLVTSVQFVCLDRDTVHPYAFHLIDLYVDIVLRFGSGEANNA